MIATVKFYPTLYRSLWVPLNIQHREKCTRRLESATETGRVPATDFVVFGLLVNIVILSVPLRGGGWGWRIVIHTNSWSFLIMWWASIEEWCYSDVIGTQFIWSFFVMIQHRWIPIRLVIFCNRTSRLPVAVLYTLLAEVLLLLIQCRLWAHEFLLYTFKQLFNFALCGNAVRVMLQHSYSFVCSFLNLILYLTWNDSDGCLF